MPPRLSPAQIAARARAYGLDPQAVLQVASSEGLSGGIGDGGHAYGPFQLNNSGGVITGTHPGRNSQQIQSWAWSPAGIDFALSRIAKVAKGKTGADAVRAIVTQFERPADPQGEIARALASGAGVGPSLAPAASPGPPQPPQQQPQQDPRQLLQALSSVQNNDYTGFYRQLGQQRPQQQARPVPQPQVQGGQPPGGGYQGPGGQVLGATQGEQPDFLKALVALAGFRKQPIRINSGYRSTAKQAQLWANRASNPNPVAKPGSSLHEQGLAADGTIGGVPLGSLPPAVLARFGLQSVPRDPVHVQMRR